MINNSTGLMDIRPAADVKLASESHATGGEGALTPPLFGLPKYAMAPSPETQSGLQSQKTSTAMTVPTRPGVAKATLSRVGIRNVSGEEAKRLIGFDRAGIAIPYTSIAGGKLMVNGREFYRMRVSDPRSCGSLHWIDQKKLNTRTWNSQESSMRPREWKNFARGI